MERSREEERVDAAVAAVVVTGAVVAANPCFEIGVCFDFDFALGVLVAFGVGADVDADVGEEGTVHDIVEA